jgi:chloramphenicol 3-O-phosphotransferase
MNEDLRPILGAAILILTKFAFDAGAVVHKDNPGWDRVVEALDDCLDELRGMEMKLGGR